MLAASRKTQVNKLKNKTKKNSCKKQLQNEQMELKTVIVQYTLDAKQIAYSLSFCTCLQTLQKNLSKLVESNFLAKDAKFLRMCTLLIAELYYKAKHYPFPPRIKKSAKQVTELLTRTFQTTSLIHAACLFSEQNPQESDLSILLTQLSLDKMEFLTQFNCKIECLI